MKYLLFNMACFYFYYIFSSFIYFIYIIIIEYTYIYIYLNELNYKKNIKINNYPFIKIYFF